MADEEVGLEPNKMKFFQNARTIDNFDTLSQDSNDDGSQLDPDFVEDRFRVDRKKLELMLQLQCQNEEETAEEFFQRVMDESNTQITWPSKLKIGAKSKKDPHIKVIGRPEDVKVAKDTIMSVLDTKSNRVTLKMDVSHTEHSHVIGKGGNNIKRVMQETACHIHFPDSNRGNNVQEKSNQVSIAGQPTGVENARIQIRELLPLVLMFELPTNGSLTAPLDTSSPSIQHIQTTYKVTVSFRQRPKVYTMTVIVRGSVCNSKAVKEATIALVEHLTGAIGTSVQVSLQLEIATQHHLFMIGRAGMNIKQIMQRTGATIHFPDPATVTPQRKGTVYVTGSMDSVIHARHQLIGCLPLVLMFDVKDSVDIDQAKVTQLMEQLDVFISVKPKPKQTSKSVIVKSIERNSVNMYVARLHLLGMGNFSRHIDNVNLTTLNYVGQNIVHMNAANTLLMMNGHSQHILGPTPSTTPTHWVPPPPGLYNPVVVMTNPAQYSLTNPLSPLDIVLHNSSLASSPGLNNNNNNNSVAVKHTAVVRVPSPSNASSSNSASASPENSSCNSPTFSDIHNASVAFSLEQQYQHAAPQSHAQVTQHNAQQHAPQTTHRTMQPSSLSQQQSLQQLTQQNTQQNTQIHHTHLVQQSHIVQQQQQHTQQQHLTSQALHFTQQPSPYSTHASTQHNNTQLSGPKLLNTILNNTQQNTNQLNGVQTNNTTHYTTEPSPPTTKPQTQPLHHHIYTQLTPLHTQPSQYHTQSTTQYHTAQTNHTSLPQTHISHPQNHTSHPQNHTTQPPHHTSQPPHNTPQTHPHTHPHSPQTHTHLTPHPSPPTFAPVIPHKTSPTSSGHTLDLLGLSKPTGSPPPGIGSSHGLGSSELSQALFHSLHCSTLQNGDLSPECSLDSPSRLERKDSNSSLFSSHGPFAFDYEHKKLLATKAIQKKPEGESRIPTDFWSGLGFSKSMPDSVIRDAFANNQLKLPNDISSLQCNGTDITDEIDMDPWKNSPTAGKAPINPAPGEYPSPRKKFTECRLSTSSYVDSIMLPKLSHLTSKADLAELFSKMGLGKYTDLFQHQEIDLSTFLTLTDHDLKELGISTFGARRKMLLAIADINKRNSSGFCPTPGSNNPYTHHASTLSPHLSTQPDMGAIDGRW